MNNNDIIATPTMKRMKESLQKIREKDINFSFENAARTVTSSRRRGIKLFYKGEWFGEAWDHLGTGDLCICTNQLSIEDKEKAIKVTKNKNPNYICNKWYCHEEYIEKYKSKHSYHYKYYVHTPSEMNKVILHNIEVFKQNGYML